METVERRYDIDWLRVIAIGLLLIYHIAIGFQPWGLLIGFIQSNEPMPSLWVPMTMLNVWRIPLLFFVSGMGVFFALRKRDWKALLLERSKRILLPFIFGIIAVAPLQVLFLLDYYDQPFRYLPSASHLWFLGNIFSYVLILTPLFYYLKVKPESKLAIGIKWLFGNPLGLMVTILAIIAEVMIIKPVPFELYAQTIHGYFIGLLAFLFGFCFVYSGEKFWSMMLKGKWTFLLLATILYALRLGAYNMSAAGHLMAVESCLWIFAAFGLAYRYLNKPSKTLSYLSKATYPIYIIHMFMLYGAYYLVFPTALAIELQLILVIAITFLGCFAFYELVIRRVWFLKPLFGLDLPKSEKNKSLVSVNSDF